jgi:glycosyltransferase involved in cell wall biosynthesis
VTRIVFLTHSGADSGAEQSIVSYLARWPPSNWRPALMLAQGGAIEDRAKASDVECFTVELDAEVADTKRSERKVRRLGAMVLGLVRHASKVHGVVIRRSTDVVVAISLKSLVFGWLAGRRAGATVVWSLHDRVHGGYFPWFVVPVLRYLVPRMVDGIMVNSKSTLATIRPGRTPVIVATPSIELDSRDFHEPRDEVKRVVMLGRLSPWKGQDLFLRSFAVAFEGSQAEAYIVGGALFGEDDYEKELLREAEELGIDDRVHFVGHVSDPWAWLVDADVLAHCSRIPEPFGRVVVQGMWARCAVVATRPGGPEEVISDGKDGLLVPCGDEQAMTEALRRLRTDATLRRRLAEGGRRTALGYDATVIAPQLGGWLTALHDGNVPAGSITPSWSGRRPQMRSASIRS